MKKSDLRVVYKQKRNDLRIEELKDYDACILEHLTKFDWSSFKYVHCYLAIEKFKEYNTSEIINWFWQKYPDIIIVSSKSDFITNELTHFQFQKDTTLKINDWGIPEPVSTEGIPVHLIDAVICPLLIADSLGNRVGYGKGFYDRFLASCRRDIVKVGISYFEPVEPIADISTWDIPLDYLITPLKTYSF